MNPFEAVCAKCSIPITTSRTMAETMVYYIICRENCHFVDFYQLNCMILADDETIYCVLRGTELEKVLLNIPKVSYQ